MKKLGRVALAAMMLFSVAACASEGSEGDKQSEKKEEEKKEVYAMKETVHLKERDVTVNKVTASFMSRYVQLKRQRCS